MMYKYRYMVELIFDTLSTSRCNITNTKRSKLYNLTQSTDLCTLDFQSEKFGQRKSVYMSSIHAPYLIIATEARPVGSMLSFYKPIGLLHADMGEFSEISRLYDDSSRAYLFYSCREKKGDERYSGNER